MKDKSNKINGLILGGILFFALIIRLYHLNFPSIGYHNMKENEFISMAKNMLKTNDFFSREIDFHYGLESAPKKIDLFPGGHLLSYQIALCLRMFGEDRFLGYSRFINIIFSIISLFFMYKIVMLLMVSQKVSLLSTFILGILPLSIFFSRNLQPEIHAFLFMLIGTYYYLLFAKKIKFSYLFLSGISAVFIFIYKFTFLVCYIPFLFIFPYRQLHRKFSNTEILKKTFLSFIPLLAIFLLFVVTKEFKFGASKGRVLLFEIFTASYWKNYGVIILDYIARENYTIFYTLSAMAGLIFIFFHEKISLLKRYIAGWCIAVIPYSIFLSDYINQHNYYQMPFLLLVAFCSAYCIDKIIFFLNKTFSKKIGNWFIIIFLIFSLFPVYNSVKAAYRTVFWGEEIAGEYLNNKLSRDERFFIHTWAQGYGICIYAGRKCGWPKDLEEFKLKEDEFNIRYLTVYPFDFFNKIPLDLKEYLSKNYKIVHIGFLFLMQSKKFIPYTLILKKGGRFDFENFMRDRQLILRKTYNIFEDKFVFYVAED